MRFRLFIHRTWKTTISSPFQIINKLQSLETEQEATKKASSKECKRMRVRWKEHQKKVVRCINQLIYIIFHVAAVIIKILTHHFLLAYSFFLGNIPLSNMKAKPRMLRKKFFIKIDFCTLLMVLSGYFFMLFGIYEQLLLDYLNKHWETCKRRKALFHTFFQYEQHACIYISC